jgi:toxin ParE1/3/4
MARFRLSRRAEADLLEITAYTLQTWGEDQAHRYLDQFESCFRKIAANPRLGRNCDQIRPGLRRFEHVSHVILFRTQADGILISRILHSRMLPDRHYFSAKGSDQWRRRIYCQPVPACPARFRKSIPRH